MTIALTPVATRTVVEDEADIRLDRWLRRHFPGLTQGAIEKFCRTGQIRVDGRRVEASARLTAGQAVRIPPLPTGPAPKIAPVVGERLVKEVERWVLYRDDHVIVIDKPTGLPVQGGPGINRHLDGMLDALRFGKSDRPRLVHRLDRDTSGVLLLARTPGVAAKLAALFRGRDVEKTYWAVVVGRPDPLEGRIEAPLVRIGGGSGERVIIAEPDDEEAARSATDYRTLDSAARKMAWLELSPITGRTHQLRVHCEALGTPILGDDKYGEGRSHLDGFADRLHLLARSLRLPHPAGGTLMVEAELPPHMRGTFRTLGFQAAPAARPVRR